MDQHELFLGCKRGDLLKIKYLVEQKEVELNIRDKWDSTPLYYACLCGHEEIVKYLLDNGARCEANTFDGERCLYGALTDQIKRLLLRYNMVSSKVMRRDLYDEFLRRLQEMDCFQDVTFHVHGHHYRIHRCVLSVRSSYFLELFRGRWKGKSDIHLKHKMISPTAFEKILEYLYTGQMEVHIDNLDECARLARQCHLDSLITEMEECCHKLTDFEASKPGVNITRVLVEQTDKWQLQMDFGSLADLALPQELCSIGNAELPFEPELASLYADVIFVVEGHKFNCHKVFFCGRSDYFRARVLDHFGEDEVSEDNLPIIQLSDIKVDIFTRVMYYLYQDTCELNEENVYEVMCAADLYLLPGLKRLCANVIARCLTVEDCVMVLRTARMFNLPRLEDQCAEFMADNLEEVLKLKRFEQLVLQDATEVENREETDTIDIIDSIRFHLTNFVQTYSQMGEVEESLRLLDDFLMSLGLDC